ncbi:MAG: ABC-type sugar transport systems permease component [Acetothermia bacterium 64_32]|nr:MAG: ABC-type sugar transport systems permease component [Acetothermia bacterium 64_32]HAF71507.1 ABC transporter substrate-binding protein [Candidatus Acetothermia bacterium]
MRAIKLTVLMLAAVVLASGLGFGEKITFWHYWDGANLQALQSLIKQYEEAHPGITIEAVFVPGAELLTKLQTAIISGKTPTIAIADLIAMPTLVRSGALIPLDEYIEQTDIDMNDFFEGPLAYGSYEGRFYSLPVSASNLGLFWNKNLFKAAGLDPERPPRTWEELVEFGRIIKEKTGKWGYELYTAGGEGTTWQWQVFLWSAGGEFLSEDLSAPAFNSEAGVRALQFWVDLIHTYQISPLAPWGLFGRGEAAMVMDGSWMTQFFPMQVNFELGAAPFPYPADGEPATNMGGEQIFIFKGDPDLQQVAWDFITWFTGTEIQVQWDRLTGFMPIRRSVAQDPAYIAWVKNARPLLLPFVESMQYARPRPPVPEYPRISDIVANYIQEALYGRMTPADALDKAAAEVAQLLR